MARSTVRPALTELLSSLQDTTGSPLFASVWDRLPTRIDKTLWPACVVFVPESQNVREGMRLKLDKFGCQLRIVFGLPSVDWTAQPSGPGGNIYSAPAQDPQVVFDALLDQLVNGLVSNQSFTQNVPGGDRTTVQLGQKISVRATDPDKRGQMVTLAAIVEFEVTELLTGV